MNFTKSKLGSVFHKYGVSRIRIRPKNFRVSVYDGYAVICKGYANFFLGQNFFFRNQIQIIHFWHLSIKSLEFRKNYKNKCYKFLKKKYYESPDTLVKKFAYPYTYPYTRYAEFCVSVFFGTLVRLPVEILTWGDQNNFTQWQIESLSPDQCEGKLKCGADDYYNALNNSEVRQCIR